MIRHANAVTSVSPWHQKTLAQYNKNSHLIYNGYDALVFTPKDITSDFFYITYLGKLYSTHLRDPRLLFDALRQLAEEKKIDENLVKVLFHTDSDGMLQLNELGQTYNIMQMLNIHGYIPRHEILPIMHQSSILLVLTTQSTPKGTHGIMGTKFFENIGVEKPILCVRSDEECIADAIQKTNAGLAATHVEEVKQFICDKYQEWLQRGYTRQHVINKEQFTRQHEAEQFEKLFSKGIHKEILEKVTNAQLAYDLMWKTAKEVGSSIGGILQKVDNFIKNLPDTNEMGDLMEKLPKEWEAVKNDYNNIIGNKLPKEGDKE